MRVRVRVKESNGRTSARASEQASGLEGAGGRQQNSREAGAGYEYMPVAFCKNAHLALATFTRQPVSRPDTHTQTI